jgi:hypothetical protein
LTLGDCTANPEWIQTGNKYRIDLRNVTNSGSLVSTQVNLYTVNGAKTFNGRTAQELQVDATATVSGVLGANVRSFNYINVSPTRYEFIATDNFIDASVGGFSFTGRILGVYEPALGWPLSVGVGDTINLDSVLTETITFEGLGAQAPTTKQWKQTYKFVAIETITVPAGTFRTCKVDLESTITSAGVSSTGKSTVWYIGEGQFRGLFAKSLAENGNLSEVTVVRRGH